MIPIDSLETIAVAIDRFEEDTGLTVEHRRLSWGEYEIDVYSDETGRHHLTTVHNIDTLADFADEYLSRGALDVDSALNDTGVGGKAA